MKYIITILLVATTWNDLNRIAKVNEVKKEAKEAYSSGNYELAAQKYTFLLDSMKVEDENIQLNLANAYYQLKDTTQALDNYGSLVDSKNKLIRSVAHQQLGIMSNRDKNPQEALDHFKDALKANPNNEDARYNYELLKKIMKEKEEEQKQQQQNQDQDQQKDQEKQDQEQEQDKQDSSDQKNKEGEQEEKEQQDQQQQQQEQGEGEQEEEQQSEQQQNEKEGEQEENPEQQPQEGDQEQKEQSEQEKMNSLSEKLKEMNISEDKARMILEAMRNNEIQYLQQNKRKASKRKDPAKPDW